MAKKRDQRNYDNTIKITNVDPKVFIAIKNIAKHKTGGDRTKFLKPELRKIIDSYPKHMHQPPQDSI